MGVVLKRCAMLLVLFFQAFGFLHSLTAETITLMWDANSEGDLAGYKIHYGTRSKVYEWMIDVGDTTSYTISNLTCGEVYFFAVTAFDTAGNESAHSDEIYGVAGTIEGSIALVSPYNYELSYVDEGDTYYLDRSYQVLDIPPPYRRLLWLKTRNDHKNYSGLEIILLAGEKIRLYVAYDSRASAPDWLLNDFIQTEDRITVSDALNTDFRVWRSKSECEPGEVITLGNNGTSITTNSMYVVMLRSVYDGHIFTPELRPLDDNVVLSWNSTSGAQGYNIYRNTEPYFYPATPLASLTELEYVDQGAAADSTEDYFYVIEAIRSAPYATTSCRMGKMSKVLEPGLNLISLPLLATNTALADIFGNALTGSSNSLTADRVMVWTGCGYELAWLVGGTGTEFDGQWVNEDGSGVSDLCIAPDQGFWVEIRQGHPESRLTFCGLIVPDSCRTIELTAGFNLLGSCFPVPVSLQNSKLRENGVITGSSNAQDSDRILSWAGSYYDIAWLLDNTGTQYDGTWFNEEGTDTTSIRFEPFKSFWIQIRPGHCPGIWKYPNPNTQEF